jgi:hypothetical protein
MMRKATPAELIMERLGPLVAGEEKGEGVINTTMGMVTTIARMDKVKPQQGEGKDKVRMLMKRCQRPVEGRRERRSDDGIINELMRQGLWNMLLHVVWVGQHVRVNPRRQPGESCGITGS